MNIRKPYYREFRRRFYETLGDKGDSILRYRGADNKEHYIASGNSPDVKPGGGMVETTWQELKDKRDAGKLIPGSLYRITDYVTMTTQIDTRSIGKYFDVVVLALSSTELSEDAWAMHSEGRAYDVTFGDGVAKCYLFLQPDGYYTLVDVNTKLGMNNLLSADLVIDEGKKAINAEAYYKTNLNTANLDYVSLKGSNVGAWKLKYCLDNDTNRFAWADNSPCIDVPASIVHDRDGLVYERYSASDTTDSGTQYYAWKNGSTTIFTNTLTPGAMNAETYRISPFPADDGAMITYDIVRSYTPAKSHPNGTGVIYRMIDEHNNDVPYDFKNIQFVRKLTDGEYDPDSGEDTWVHTFTWLDEDGVALDASVVAQNITSGGGRCTGCHDNVIGACSAYGMGIKGNTFVFALNDIVFISAYSYGDGIYYGCYGNKFGADCHSNTFGNECNGNTFGNYFYGNTFRDGCSHNTFGNECNGNTFGNNCQNNTFGNDCSNTFGNECRGNTFGNNCQNNTFGNNCQNNTFGNDCRNNTFGNNCQNNTFGNDCGSNTFGNECRGNTFGNSCQFIKFGANCNYNTFGNNCQFNTFGNNAEKCSVGDGVQNIAVSKDYMRYVVIENGNQKITITSNKTTSSSAYLQNFLIALGVNNSNTAKTISHNSVNDTFKTTYQNANSDVVDV